MKVVEHLAKARRPLISFEIIPPLRGGDVRGLLALIDDLQRYQPPFIDITSHSAEAIYEETKGGQIHKRIKRKRPGTLGLCALIQNKFNIDAVPHLLCNGFSREETEDMLIELKYLGIDNVLAVRGDFSGYVKPLLNGRSANGYAVDLVRQIVAMNDGRYLEDDLLDAEPSDFCVGVAGYPEKHFEAPNLGTDIRHAQEKVDAGAEYIVTQMFFDNPVYFDYVEACRAAGIEVPIIPGLKVITTRNHLQSLPTNFHVSLPSEVVSEIEEADPKHTRDIGVSWALRQVQELLERGVPAVHFYVMQSAAAINEVMKRLDL